MFAQRKLTPIFHTSVPGAAIFSEEFLDCLDQEMQEHGYPLFFKARIEGSLINDIEAPASWTVEIVTP